MFFLINTNLLVLKTLKKFLKAHPNEFILKYTSFCITFGCDSRPICH